MLIPSRNHIPIDNTPILRVYGRKNGSHSSGCDSGPDFDASHIKIDKNS